MVEAAELWDEVGLSGYGENLVWGVRRADRLIEHMDNTPLGEAVVFSSCSPARESVNEDGAVMIWSSAGDWAVFAVADGLGGQAAGQAASEAALNALAGSVCAATPDGEGLRELVLRGFDRANREVLALGNGSATTMAVVEIVGRQLRSYHVGDSGALIFGQRGKLKLQTIAHSPVGYALEAGVLDEMDAMLHEDRHLVSNVVGFDAMHVGMSSSFRLAARDTVVLASDGLFDNLYVDEIIERMRAGPLDAAVEAVVNESEKRMSICDESKAGHPDDLTLVAFRPARSPL